MLRRALSLALIVLPPLLAGCDLFGGESAEALAVRKDAEGKAVGGACRHAGRAIEDCYALNKRSDKAAVFAGWREMNDYMRDNKVDTVPPQGLALPTGGSGELPDATVPVKPPAARPKRTES